MSASAPPGSLSLSNPITIPSCDSWCDVEDEGEEEKREAKAWDIDGDTAEALLEWELVEREETRDSTEFIPPHLMVKRSAFSLDVRLPAQRMGAMHGHL